MSEKTLQFATTLDKFNSQDELAKVKAEQRLAKTQFSSKFINELNGLLDKCFLPLKNKKEHFITKEKLVLDFLKLLQSQKKFKDSNTIAQQLRCTAVMDKETQMLGRVLTIDMVKQTVEYITQYTLREKQTSIVKSFNDVEFFDPYTIGIEKYYALQTQKGAKFGFQETFIFLTSKWEEAGLYQNEKVNYTNAMFHNDIKIKKRHLETDIVDL